MSDGLAEAFPTQRLIDRTQTCQGIMKRLKWGVYCTDASLEGMRLTFNNSEYLTLSDAFNIS